MGHVVRVDSLQLVAHLLYLPAVQLNLLLVLLQLLKPVVQLLLYPCSVKKDRSKDEAVKFLKETATYLEEFNVVLN